MYCYFYWFFFFNLQLIESKDKEPTGRDNCIWQAINTQNKKLLQLNHQKNLILKCIKDLTDNTPKKIYKWPTTIQKDAQYHIKRNANQNHKTWHPSGWPQSTEKNIISVDKPAGKAELLCTVGGNVKWCCHTENSMAGHCGSCLLSQHFGRPRWADHLGSGVWDQPGQHGKPHLY